MQCSCKEEEQEREETVAIQHRFRFLISFECHTEDTIKVITQNEKDG